MRYVPAGQWHITTAFYGDVAGRTGPPSSSSGLRRAAGPDTGDDVVTCVAAGTFPKQAIKARVLWVGNRG